MVVYIVKRWRLQTKYLISEIEIKSYILLLVEKYLNKLIRKEIVTTPSLLLLLE